MKHRFELWPYMVFDYREAERHLNQMAQEGFAFVRGNILDCLAVYEKTEPGKYRYCVDCVLDPVDEAAMDYYKTLCRDAGWEFICCHGDGLCIFRSEASEAEETPLPVATDMDIFHHNIFHQIGAKWGTALLLVGYIAFMLSGGGLIFLIWGIGGIYALIQEIVWIFRRRSFWKAKKSGDLPPLKTERQLRSLKILRTLYLCIWIVGVFLLAGLFLWVILVIGGDFSNIAVVAGFALLAFLGIWGLRRAAARRGVSLSLRSKKAQLMAAGGFCVLILAVIMALIIKNGVL